MPTIDIIERIKINIYNGDHRPEHIHVVYNEFEELIEIITYNTYAGYLPHKQRKKAIDWLKNNKEWALNIFKQLNPHLYEKEN